MTDGRANGGGDLCRMAHVVRERLAVDDRFGIVENHRAARLGELAPEEREISKGVIEDVLKREGGVVIANVEQDAKFSELSSIINLKILSVMCVPLKITLRGERASSQEVISEPGTSRSPLRDQLPVESSHVAPAIT